MWSIIVEVASKIAEVFAVTIDYLIGKDHNMAVDKKNTEADAGY